MANNIDKALFKKLTKDREDSAVILEKQSMSGLKSSVVEKYSDQAHFIYELLQNADDAGATEARFDLYDNRLVFIHNGCRLFSITDVDNEKTDSKNGRLGDLNSITSIANSSKNDSSQIGKFGVGFKAVFQYTETPHIYDPNFAFKIERFIVPVLIENDFKDKKRNETAFVFPFDHPKRDANTSYKDIQNKLKKLVFPTLFLKNLKTIKYSCGDVKGEYTKKVKETRHFTKGTKAELIEFNGVTKNENKLWLFSRETSEGYSYSCGFFIDDKSRLVKTKRSAFCFFPTKKETNLNFIINAPFLLTDSREGIRADVKHNVKMIDLLARLSADSFVYLRDIGLENSKMIIDDSIIDYLPIDEDIYIPESEYDEISFYPFYERIKDVFKSQKILPSFKEYVFAKDAYFPNAALLSELISNDQLAELKGNKNARWIFPSLGWESISRTKNVKRDYLSDIVSNSIVYDTSIIDLLTPKFVKEQSTAWLNKLYKFILERSNRLDKAKTAPIFYDETGQVVAAFDGDGNEVLFLDDGYSKGYKTLSKKYSSNVYVKDLINHYGIKEPELKDKIYSKVLKKDELNPEKDFRELLKYYVYLKDSYEDTADFVEEICDRKFISAISADGLETRVSSPEELYYPTDNLIYYFENSKDVWFVDLDKYKSILGPTEMKYFEEFLSEMGAKKYADIHNSACSNAEIKQFKIEWPSSTSYTSWEDNHIANDRAVLTRIIDNDDKKLSIILWNQLINVYEIDCYGKPSLGGIYKYFNRISKRYRFEGPGLKRLKTSEWLYDKFGKRRSVETITIQDLSPEYDITSDKAKSFINCLGIKDEHPELEGLDETIRSKVELYDELEKLGVTGFSKDELILAINLLNEKKEKEAKEQEKKKEIAADSNETDTPKVTEEKIVEDISKRISDKKVNVDTSRDGSQVEQIEIQEPIEDNDELIKSSVDYSKKIEKAKQKCEEEIAQLAVAEEARMRVDASEKYSYGWFSGLLELEALENYDENARSREISISFSKVEKVPDSSRTLLLKQPNKNIPQVVEELVDIPLELRLDNGDSKRLIIEAANVQSYTLRVKVKFDDAFSAIDFSSVTQANINAKNPSFLIRELQNEFLRFGTEERYEFKDDFDMQANLCENIKFIFGPPGTGKTTFLAKETLIPLIANNDKVKILVLTPTNKSADVLVSRTMEIMGEDKGYEDWLIRYGVTCDEKIEGSKVFHSKDFEINDYNKCAIVTTMARFPYDYFIDSDGKRNHLHGINWDYIVVDEASMIPLVQMVYVLYLKTPKQFIIAGDPFQIEPTVSVSDWKDENIYEMVNLKEFSKDVETKPHKYEVELLTTQYRSVPSVGTIFSALTYKGVLNHARSEDDAKPLNIEKYLDYKNLNIVRFPVSKFESIYKSKYLKRSSYHVYSAIFAFEFVQYLANSLVKSNGDKCFNIGIISPYSAQAGLIDKLLASAKIPKCITITSGTIHGFQGDECDIVIALFNPPSSITTSKGMFLNKQNIVNVAISRARDYLFVLVPDEDTDRVENLTLVNKLISSIQKSKEYNDIGTHELESVMFNNEKYLEDNAFATGHQSVNVYGVPEQRYEVRSEDNALDVQVHGNSYYYPFVKEKADVVASKLVGELVYSKSYGNGIVKEFDDKYIIVDFENEKGKSFQYPKCFFDNLEMKNQKLSKEFRGY